MPYAGIQQLPARVRDRLPVHAQQIYVEAFNSAWERYREPEDRRGGASREETAHRVAWAAVKQRYEKDPETGEWREKTAESSASR
jgi:cation transport regulator